MEAKEQDTFSAIVEAIDSTEYEPERHLSIQIDEALRDAVVAAKNCNQGASVTVSIKIKPGADRRLTFTGTVSSKIPHPPVSAATLYADANGKVHRQDPNQTRLDFYDATAKQKES